MFRYRVLIGQSTIPSESKALLRMTPAFAEMEPRRVKRVRFYLRRRLTESDGGQPGWGYEAGAKE